MIGRTISHYQVLGKLGEGGMGVVYRAADTRLNREVALKVLPAEFASDAGRMARLEREAKVLASLNHPNIAAIHGLEDHVLVMELVEGTALRGPLPMDTALDYARQIADALEYAHEKGIIHRDLKPANIKITPGGRVKVLDFGLAKMTQPVSVSGDPNSPTLTMSLTEAGAIVGTPGYMAPEQARGKPADKSADIWAFGCVLYEMLTGRQLFAGETISDTIAAVLTREPDWNRVPVKVRRLLRQCLEKDPKRRLHSIADAWMLLDEAPAAPAARSRLLPVAVAVCAILAAVAIWALWAARRSVQPTLQPVIRLDVDLGSEVELSYEAGPPLTVSPDGTRLVYCSQSRLFTRRLDQTKPVELPGTESGFAPFFSPDGQWVAFFTPGELKKISVHGGTAIRICQALNAGGGSWGDDGNIVASLGGGHLSRIPSAGGAPVRATALEPAEYGHRWPQVLPGGRGVLFTTFASAYGVGGANIEMLASGGRRRTLQRGATWARYLPSGHLTYVSNGTLFAVPFDLDKLAVRGTPSPVLGDVAYNSGFGSAHIDYSGAVSGAGIAVYQSGAGTFGLTTVQWLDSAGQASPLLAKPRDYLTPRLSPDGNRLALTSAGDIWVCDWRRDTMVRLSVSGGSNPVWTADGRYLVFGTLEGMTWNRADGAGEPRPLTQSNSWQYPFSLTTDGKRLAFLQFNPETGFDIWTLPLESDGTGLRAGQPEPFLLTPFDERHPAFSPDGRWIAYASNESGTFQVYVRAFPASAHGGGGKWQVSSSGGVYPTWSHTSRELLFRTLDSRIMSAAYTVRGDSFEAAKPRLWSEKRLANLGLVRNYDLAPDGKRIAALMPAEGPEGQNAHSRVIFLLNFFDELRRRVPTGTK